MARTRPPTRTPDLVRAGAQVFLAAGGYHRAQIRDVARAMGVAKGTVYLYVESKAALFDLVLRHADDPDAAAPALPVPTPASGATVAHVAALVDAAALPALDGAPTGPAGARDELARVVDQLFSLLHAHRWTIRLVNAAAADLPELGDLWFRRARGGLNRALGAWLAARAAAGLHRPLAVPPAAAARLVTELIHWFAVARCFDAAPDDFDTAAARAAVQLSLARTFLPVSVAP